jgi:hypothetical protein
MLISTLIVNVVLYFSFCILAGTGLMLEFRLGDSEATVFGMNGGEWSEIHETMAYIFLAFAILHLILHQAWLRKLAGRHYWKTTLGLAAGACLIGVLLLIPEKSHSEKPHTQSQEESCGKDS